MKGKSTMTNDVLKRPGIERQRYYEKQKRRLMRQHQRELDRKRDTTPVDRDKAISDLKQLFEA